MGRNKIKIEKIANERNRQATFFKRKNGLFKKAMELSILCDCDVALLVFSPQDKLFRYASTDLAKVLERFHNYKDESHDMSNDDYFKQFAPNEDPNAIDDGTDSPPPAKKQKTTTGTLSRSGSNAGPTTRRKKLGNEYEDEEDEDFRQTKRESTGRRTRSSKLTNDEEPGPPSTSPLSNALKSEQYQFPPPSYPGTNSGPTPYSGFHNEEYAERNSSAPPSGPYSHMYPPSFPPPPPPLHANPVPSHGPPHSSLSSGNDSHGGWHPVGSSSNTDGDSVHSLPPLPPFGISPSNNDASVPIAPKPTKASFAQLTIAIPPRENSQGLPTMLSPMTSPTSFCPKIPLSPNLGPNPPLFSGYKSPRTPTTPSAPFSMDFGGPNFRASFLPHLEAAFNRPEDEVAGLPFMNSAFNALPGMNSQGGSVSGPGPGSVPPSLFHLTTNGKQAMQSRDSSS